MNVQSSQVQGPSGSVNTGVSNQSQRTMTAGPAIERKQQNIESKVANAGAVLDDLLSQMSQTQDARIEAKTKQVSTTRANNKEMTDATQGVDRKNVVEGKGVAVGVELGGRRSIKKRTKEKQIKKNTHSVRKI